MIDRRLVPTALLLALLLAPSGLAGTPLEADRVVVEGVVAADNLLGVLALRVAYEGDIQPTLKGHGAHVRVETDHEAANHTPGAVHVAPEHWTSIDHEGALSFETLQVREAADLFVAADLRPQLAINSSRLEAMPSQTDQTTQRQFLVQDREPLTIDVASDARLGQLPGAHLTITGSFTLSFWEWDLIVQEGNGTEYTVPSGSRTEHIAPPAAGVPTLTSSHARHVYLFVEEGRLELTWPDSIEESLFARPTKWMVAGTVRLDDDRHQAGESVLRFDDVDETLRLRLDALGDPSQDVSLPTADDRTPTATVRAHEPAAAGPVWLMPAIVLLGVATALLVRVTRRRRDLRELTALESALGLGAAEMVAEASRPKKNGPHASRWAVLHVAALLRSVRYAEAVAYLEADPCPRLVPTGVYHYLLAAAHAGTGDREKARAAMCLCLSEAPQMQEELAGNPLLEGLLGGRTMPEGYA